MYITNRTYGSLVISNYVITKSSSIKISVVIMSYVLTLSPPPTATPDTIMKRYLYNFYLSLCPYDQMRMTVFYLILFASVLLFFARSVHTTLSVQILLFYFLPVYDLLILSSLNFSCSVHVTFSL